MNKGCRLSPRRVAASYVDKRSSDFRAVVTAWSMGDVVVYDPEDDPDITALASVDVDVELGTFTSDDKKRVNTQLVLSYDRDSIELSEAELVGTCFDISGKTGSMVPSGGFSRFKEAVRKSVSNWLGIVKTVIAGALEKKVVELYPEEGEPLMKSVIDNEFMKSPFKATLMDTGFDPRWAQERFAARGHQLDARAKRYVESRVAVARESAGW